MRIKVKEERFYLRKKSLSSLLGCLIFLLYGTGEAQAQFGFRGGVSISNFYHVDRLSPEFDYMVDFRPYLGYDIEFVQLHSQKPLVAPFFGVYYSWQNDSRWGFRPELDFTYRGVDFSHTDHERLTYKVRINYLEIPFSFFYQFIQKEIALLELYFGGYAAFKTQATKKVAVNQGWSHISIIQSARDLDGGIHIGGNYKQKISESLILFDIRIYLGFTQVFSIPEDWTPLYFKNQKIKSTGVNLTLGYEL